MKLYRIIVLVFSIMFYMNGFPQGQWTQQNSGTSASLNSVFFVNKDTGFVATETGYLLKTTNGGTAWNQAGIGAVEALCFLNSQVGFASGGSSITKTLNGGSTWTSCFYNPDFDRIAGICFPDNNHGYAVIQTQNLSSILAKTLNGGTTWDTSYSAFGFFNCVFFTDSLTGYIGAGNGKAYKTIDGGNLWTTLTVDNISSSAVYAIHFPTPDTGYAGTDNGMIFKTTNAGQTWSLLTSGIPGFIYSINFCNSGTGYAAGGDGMSTCVLIETVNGGTTWTQNASCSQTLMSVYFPTPNTGYAVGRDGTILKYSVGVGIQESDDENGISVYPNPIKDNVTIETLKNEGNSKTISIHNLQGQLLLLQPFIDRKINVDVSLLPKGFYYMEIYSDDGFVIKKLVKE